MARMLGRYLTGGCSSGGRPCVPPGPDCAGHEPDPRRFKRREQREVDELVRGYVTALWAEDWDSLEDSAYDGTA
jgi:hypothetical protein